MTMWRRWLRFNGVGGLGIGVQLAVIAALAHFWRVDYRAATSAGVAAAIVHNFLWHRVWTWPDRHERGIGAFARFVAANGVVSLGGNMLVTTALVSGAHLAVVPANVGAIALCALVNFWLADRAVFGGSALGALKNSGSEGRTFWFGRCGRT
jgi:putative flippase GtrA